MTLKVEVGAGASHREGYVQCEIRQLLLLDIEAFKKLLGITLFKR